MEEDGLTTELHRTQVNLEGLLEVLGKNLYSSPVVAVRELIQNSHDACVRRRVEAQDKAEERIHLRTFPEKGELHIEDSGAGLTKSEIVDYLATIGSGYTRQLRQQSNSTDMIGYYGLGFLTAYVVSKRVEVYTCSYQDSGQAWKFISSDGQRFSIESAANRPVGSKVVLSLDNDFRELANSEVLLEVLRRYCCLLEIKIYLNDDPEPVNNLQAPWKLEDSQVSALRMRKARLEFAGLFERVFEPICTIPVKGNEAFHFNGLIWVHDGSTYATTDHRSVTVFVRDMFITDKARELLPHWAGFASCVIESNVMVPTASREEVQQDASYYHIQEMIYEQLIDGLIKLKDTEPETFKRILYRHNEHLLGASISDGRLFEALAEKLKLPTSEGELALPEILAQSNRQFNVTLEEQGGYELILSRALKTPVVYGYRFAAYPFCKQYAEMHNIKIAVLGTLQGNEQLFAKVSLDQHKLTRLQELLAQPGESVIAASFSPDYIPTIMVPDEEVLLKKRIEGDEANKRISAAALSLARSYTNDINDEVHAHIYVNTASPLIQRLLESSANVQARLSIMMRAFMLSLGRNDQTHMTHSLSTELENYSDSLMALLDMLENNQ